MQEENTVAQEPIRSLVGYVGADTDTKNAGKLGMGTHGYIVTDVVSKRGYGLKNIIPSKRGYIKGDKNDLCIVESVFDAIYGKTVLPECGTPACGLIIAANRLLHFAIDSGVKSVWLGVPKIQLASAMATNFDRLRKMDFKDKNGTVIPYASFIQTFIRAVDALTERGITVTVENVVETDMGIMSAQVNSELAVLNAGSATCDHFSLVGADGYWNHTHGRHPLLCHPRLIFRSQKEFGGLPDYLHTMDYEKAAKDKKDLTKLEIEIGQNLAHARYAVVRPHEIDPLITEVAKKHCTLHRTKHGNLAVMYLTSVFSKYGHSLLERFGAAVLANNTYVTELIDGRGNMYTHDLPIPRASLRSTQVYARMEDTLKEFERHYAEEPGVLNYHFGSAIGEVTATDVTDLFSVVTTSEKGKDTYKPNKAIELPNITVTTKVLFKDEDKLELIDIKLTIGYDMPSRNTIAALLNDKFKAYVLVYRDTEVTVRHLTVVFSSYGSGIFTTPFSARTFLLNKQ